MPRDVASRFSAQIEAGTELRGGAELNGIDSDLCDQGKQREQLFDDGCSSILSLGARARQHQQSTMETMRHVSETPTPDFRMLFESAPGLYLVLTPGLVIVAASDAYLSATMTKRDEITGRHIFDVFPDNPEDTTATGVTNLRASLERVISLRTEDAMAVQRYDIRKQGSEEFETRFWSPVNSPVLASDGTLAFIVHRVEDVTAFVQLRQRSSEQARLTDVLRSEAERMEAEIYRRAQQLQTANETVRQLNESLERRVAERTESLRKAEEKLLHSQKMEAIARLTGGIAHDFNNMLAVIISGTYMLKEAVNISEEQIKLVDQVEFAAQRAAALTRQLLTFSRQQIVQVRSIELNATVSEMLTMLHRLVGENIELRTKLCEQSTRVLADPSQMDQVLANLVVNARDAMPRGGSITIETERLRISGSNTPQAPSVEPGVYVLLSVSDTGSGMSAETKSKIFEPFFTTKERGRGTGLGLSTVHGIVALAGGQISVYSEIDHGTVFRILWPADESSGEVQAGGAPMARSRRGHETVLLVEDEALLRASTSALLRRRGYQVLAASNGDEALHLCRNHADEIDLLATDLIMPGIDGHELAQRARELRPTVKVLFMSGYASHVLDDYGCSTDRGFVQKPFEPDRLLTEVRRVLDARSAE